MGNRDEWCKSTLSRASTELTRSIASSSSSSSLNLTGTHDNVEDMASSIDSTSRTSILFNPQEQITPTGTNMITSSSTRAIVTSTDMDDDVTGVHWIASTLASNIGEDHQILTWPGDSPLQQDNSTHDTASTISDSSESMPISETSSNASFDSTGENLTREEIRAFKRDNPKSLVVTTEDKNKKEKAKHNRKGQKMTRFLRVSE